MSSSATIDIKRVIVLQRIAKAWDKRPDLSLGALVARSWSVLEDRVEDLGAIDDDKLIELIERFVLLGK